MSKPCLDDSCDGSHCSVCGGHFVDFHNHNLTICDQCDQLSPEEQEAKRAEIKALWEQHYPTEGLDHANPA